MMETPQMTTKYGLVVIAATAGVAYVASAGHVSAQRAETLGRAPFQTVLSVFIDPNEAQVYRRFVVPAGRRLEIHNVNAWLRLSEHPQEFGTRCTVATPGQFGSHAGTQPILLTRTAPPRPGSVDGIPLDLASTQPTLFHAFAGQTIRCVFERFPANGHGFIEWTLSGFTDAAQ
jgi:hypothetical protein